MYDPLNCPQLLSNYLPVTHEMIADLINPLLPYNYWPRHSGNTPSVTSNMLFNSDNVGMLYNGNNGPDFPLPGSETEGTSITDPARRGVRIPDHYPTLFDLDELLNGDDNERPTETRARSHDAVAGHQGQGGYEDNVHLHLSAHAENDVRGGEEDVPGSVTDYRNVSSPSPSTSASVEQSRRPPTESDPFTPWSLSQRSVVESEAEQQNKTMIDIDEDDEDSDTTIRQSRPNNQAESSDSPYEGRRNGRPNGCPQFRAQDKLHRHLSQPTSTAEQSISSRSCRCCNSPYYSTPTRSRCSTCPSPDASTPASGTSSRSGCGCCGFCINAENRLYRRDQDMKRVGRRSTRSDISSVERSATASTTASTGPASISTDLQWERPTERHRQRYSMRLHQRIDFQSHRPRVLFRQPPGYLPIIPGPRRRQRGPSGRPVLSGTSQTRPPRHPTALNIPHHQLVPILWLMFCGLLATAPATSELSVVAVSRALWLFVCSIWGFVACGGFW